MKVGFDAVTLGAIAKIDNEFANILDLGAGTGIISLMLSQRYNSIKIDALEVDISAYSDLIKNIKNSNFTGPRFNISA